MTLAEVKIENRRAHMHTHSHTQAHIIRTHVFMYGEKCQCVCLKFAHLSAVCVVIMQIIRNFPYLFVFLYVALHEK